MAAGITDIAQLLRVNNRNMSGGLADELLESARFVAAIAAQESSHGTKHDYLIYDDAPPATYRALNAGVSRGHPTDREDPTDLQILDASFNQDINRARSFRGGEAASLDFQGRRHLRTAFATLERQIIYGNGTGVAATNDPIQAGGHVGLRDYKPTIASGDPWKNVINKGGSTGPLTSVWLVRSRDPMTDTSVVLGNGGNITIGDPYKTDIGTHPSVYTAWGVDISAYYGFQAGAMNQMARICNIDTDDNANFTDDDIANAITTFPASMQPTHILMNQKALSMLRANRTATNPQGVPAGFPDSAFGIPIVLTDHIINDEDTVA